MFTKMIKAFLHIATMGEYQKIFDELISSVFESKLINNIDELNICLTGDGELIFGQTSPNIKIHRVGKIDEFEFPTLQLIENEINKTDSNIKILYFNGLGVTGNNLFKQSWRKYLTYFNIYQFMECIKALDNGYNVAGVDWRIDPVPHFSGNFWWANSSYLKTLPKIQSLNKPYSPIILTLRHNAEMYIGMNNSIVKPRILHQSNVSQYERHLYSYDYEFYLNKISTEDVIKER